MEAEIKSKWVEALRSGKYKQTTKVLRNFDGYCCLGVLREVMDPHDTTSLEGAGEMLNEDQIARANLSHKRARELAEMNDGGCDFNEIADTIEGA